jgi:SH3 domain protein
LMAQEPTHFITDDVYVYIHGGPGNQYRILGSIEAGQAITSLNETQDEYTKIIDHKGREGWIKADLITTKKSIRSQLPDLEEGIAKAKDEQKTATDELVAAQSALDEANQQISQLKQLLINTEKQRDTIKQKVASVEDEQQFVMWQQGGMIAAIGALIGIFLVYLPRPQRRNKNRWM